MIIVMARVHVQLRSLRWCMAREVDSASVKTLIPPNHANFFTIAPTVDYLT
jgi:hypothetical protein